MKTLKQYAMDYRHAMKIRREHLAAGDARRAREAYYMMVAVSQRANKAGYSTEDLFREVNAQEKRKR